MVSGREPLGADSGRDRAAQSGRAGGADAGERALPGRAWKLHRHPLAVAGLVRGGDWQERPQGGGIRRVRARPRRARAGLCLLSFTSWTESLDVRGETGGTIAERTQRARPERVKRPAQFDLGEVFDRVGDAIRYVAPDAKRVGVDLDQVDDGSVGLLVRVLGNALGLPWDSIFDDLRAIKDPDEIAHLRLACELTEIGIGRRAKTDARSNRAGGEQRLSRRGAPGGGEGSAVRADSGNRKGWRRLGWGSIRLAG